mmetsp:Transcript_89513/g.187009  ORF Transcript_89513/g.187009 Transcript_89513/m.187009 type:complete len:560 (-) Transcript_89513:213-1892(-)|eukprot:CAMPEP_0206458460 /NCGR_PEP_ID=MMETSP0324_2-20121206/23585_1 /ASSEMBLY_ACC=CAM_ASM_000836 /TAXON_ID=2866 /ORGANISM="Crypthecodinium cohnii, Strain Seligo" /LENGTH=559 /DNA_ID=CAMNT_0053929807 /DNA_START=89 /DNA_END=1768 /DNA_ORIENTATION=+
MAARAIVLLISFSSTVVDGSRPRESEAAPVVTLDGVSQLLNLTSDARSHFLTKAREELAENEAKLRPILSTLPHEDLRFPAPAVRYALHRHFSRQYGWHLKGLEPLGERWNSSSPMQATILGAIPQSVRGLFEQRLQEGGLTEEEVTVLAATMELLVHNEAQDRLRGVMCMLNYRTTDTFSVQEIRKARDWYMTSYMLGKSPWTSSRMDLQALVADMPELYPAWPQAMAMIDGLMQKRLGDKIDKKHPSLKVASFPDLVTLVEDIGHNFGPWQNTICTDLKSALLNLKGEGTGRVALSEFYKAGMNGQWQFQEKADYMEKLGSLDTSVKGHPRVIISNWIQSPSNCLGTAESHDVCCISECESMLTSIETSIAAPSATPEQISDIVSNLASPIVAAGRVLPDLLMNRLQSIAASNDGQVPLFGRMFAQWMHHAFPNECTYPHLAGATKPVNIFEWEGSHQELPLATEESMSAISEQKQRADAPVLNAVWVNEEELPVDIRHSNSTPVGAAFIHFAVVLGASCVALLGVGRTALRALRPTRGSVGLGKGGAYQDVAALSV